MPTTRLWLLGAPDPEMGAIERLLTAAGERIAYATADGRRVHPGSAYRCDPVAGATHYVECGPIDGYPDGAVVIDHHRPGDPGFGRPPAEYLSASSVGQVIAELARHVASGRVAPPEGWEVRTRRTYTTATRPQVGWQYHTREAADYSRGRGVAPLVRVVAHPLPEYVVSSRADTPARAWGESPDERRPAGYAPPSREGEYTSVRLPDGQWRDWLLAAAADHCLGAAYRGECPGVDPDELMQWRAESLAAFQGRAVADVLADIAAAQQTLRDAEDIYIDVGPMPGGETYFERLADMRRPEPIPELPEAAMRMGVGYISGPLATPDGRRKITCSGTDEQVSAFLGHWAPTEGLVDTYGDPSRGFAGGYLPD